MSFSDPHLDGEVERENGGRRAKVAVAACTVRRSVVVNISGKDGIGKRADMKGNHSQGGEERRGLACSTNCRPVLSLDYSPWGGRPEGGSEVESKC